MAERGFLDHNDLISYPLVDGDPRGFAEGGSLPRQGLTDARFLMGVSSQFDPGLHTVRLHQFFYWGTGMRLYFRSDSPGLVNHQFRFDFAADAPFGTVVRTMVSLIDAPYTDDGTLGEGAIVLGDLAGLRALGGWRTVSGNLRVESALIQSMHGLFASSINLANQRRPCPPVCGSSPLPVADSRCAYVTGLTGALRFREGYNMKISVLEASRVIQLESSLGAGAGQPCSDRIIDDPSSSSSGAPDCSFEESRCAECDGMIVSINGLATEDGRFAIVAGQGVRITDDPVNHKITVKLLEEERICLPAPSSSGP